MTPVRLRIAAALLAAGLVAALVGVALVRRSRHAPAAARPAANEDDELAQLNSLGYVGHVPVEHRGDLSGVVLSLPRRSARGLTGFGSRTGAPRGYLVDPEGRELWRWTVRPARGTSLLWMEPTRDGNLLACGRGYLLKMRWNGEILWQAPAMEYHHGFAQGPQGEIIAMASQGRVVESGGHRLPIADDLLVVLSPDGVLRERVSLLDLLGPQAIPPALVPWIEAAARGRKVPPRRLQALGIDDPRDVLHLNSVAVLDRDLGVARQGDLLVGLRSLNLVVAIARAPWRIVWRWRAGEDLLDRPHYPRPLADGHLLIFDNGWHRRFSRLVEVDPRSGAIAWSYTASPPDSFFTQRGGMAQPLPNGNLLVTQADAGRLFEIDRAGERVWDFWNPHFSMASDGSRRRETIYRGWRWFADDLRGAELPAPVARWLAAERARRDAPPSPGSPPR